MTVHSLLTLHSDLLKIIAGDPITVHMLSLTCRTLRGKLPSPLTRIKGWNGREYYAAYNCFEECAKHGHVRLLHKFMTKHIDVKNRQSWQYARFYHYGIGHIEVIRFLFHHEINLCETFIGECVVEDQVEGLHLLLTKEEVYMQEASKTFKATHSKKQSRREIIRRIVATAIYYDKMDIFLQFLPSYFKEDYPRLQNIITKYDRQRFLPYVTDELN